MTPKRVVIVGGGITGLACAYTLVSNRPGAVHVTLLEKSARLGGNIRTEKKGGFVIDAGPDSWVASKPDASNLARALKLGPELMPTVETNRRVYVAWDKRLHPMPEGMVLGIPTEVMPMVTSGLFDYWAKLRMGLEPLVPVRRFEGDEDESVGAFVARRLGDELADRLVAPLLGGIFAGDAYAISVRAAFPQLVDAEQKHGSLVQAMRAQRRARLAASRRDADENGAGEAGNGVDTEHEGERTESRRSPAPSAFESIASGMGSLIDALATALAERGVDVRTGVGAARVTRAAAGADHAYVVETDAHEALGADEVVLTGASHASARLVETLDASLASALAGLMGYTSTATVFFGLRRSAVAHDLDGTGFLVPRTLGRPMMAVTWVSSKWDHRAPAGHVLVRAFLGGVGHEDVLQKSDDELVQIALGEMRRFVPITERPLFTRVFRFERASPQMHLGHLARLRELREHLRRLPGLYVAGSGFDGAGIPDCIRQGRTIADAINPR